MRNLWILSGPSGVGKSTWLKNHMSFFIGTTSVISRDAIRFSMIKDGEEYFKHEKEVYRSFINATIYSLNNYENTIVDATHLNAASRWKLIHSIGAENLKDTSINVICLTASLETCLSHNENREGLVYVPASALKRMWFSFVLPNFEDEDYINKIYIYNIDKPTEGYRILERD